MQDNIDLFSYLLGKSSSGGGGGDITLKTLNVDINGFITAPSGEAYNKVRVQVPTPTLEDVTITENGTTEAVEGRAFKKVTVDVETYPEPTGKTTITTNGTHDVKSFATAEVNVESYPEPSGKKVITENGTDIDVKDYATVDVNVEGGEGEGYTVTSIDNEDGTQTLQIEDGYFPTDELEITENGTYDLKGYGSAKVDVQGGGDANSVISQLVNETYTDDIELENGITKIKDFAFSNLNSVKHITMPNTITTIGGSAFTHCENLESLTLSTALTSIGSNCFQHCNKLTEIEIPPLVTSIPNYCLSRLDLLSAVVFKGKPNTIATSSFSYSPMLVDIYVPWSEGEIAGAPWGATKATIHYNYTEG